MNPVLDTVSGIASPDSEQGVVPRIINQRKGNTHMSHIIHIEAKIRDPAALAAACTRLGLAPPVEGRARLFTTEASGLIVQLPGWTYPAVIDVASGSVAVDNYNGAWGEQRELDRLLQAYAVEKSKIEARRAGHQITEQALADGSIKLTIQVGGVA